MTTALHFDEATHTYTRGGKRLGSVTQQMETMHKFAKVDKEILERKQQLGTAVHKAIELNLQDRLNLDTLDPRVQPYLEAFWYFMDLKRPTVILSEQRFSHPTLGYAGTLDLLVEMDQFEWLIDIKSCVVHYPCTGIQLSAYNELLEVNGYQNQHRQRAALRLTEKGTFDLKRYASPDDWITFRSLLNLNNWTETYD